MIRKIQVFNERDARIAKATLAEIGEILTSDSLLSSIVEGLPIGVVDGYRRALAAQKTEIQAALEAYTHAKDGNPSALKKFAGNDLGLSLIIARVVKGYSQKELARRLGLKEQQIQRYEIDRYRSISLSNFRRIANVLDVSISIRFSDDQDATWGGRQSIINRYSKDDIRNVLNHARKHGWFDEQYENQFGEEIQNYLERYISDHFLKYGSPTLLRTGLNVNDLSNDLALVSWKSRISRIAEQTILQNKGKFEDQRLDISWLINLAQLSGHDEGPAKASEMLLDRGIVLAIEPQLPGLKLDGAAFLVNDIPVIGLTLRRDTIDNFWFTLFHEVAHIVLHQKIGLSTGFFDDTENNTVDEIEKEANDFAEDLLIPREIWRTSPARIAKTSEPVEKLARELKIHPSIIFGRIQKERGNYKKFADRIGRGQIRKHFLSDLQRTENAA